MATAISMIARLTRAGDLEQVFNSMYATECLNLLAMCESSNQSLPEIMKFAFRTVEETDPALLNSTLLQQLRKKYCDRE